MMVKRSCLALLIIGFTNADTFCQTPDVIEQIGGVLGTLGAPPKYETAWGKPLGNLQAGIRPTGRVSYDIVVRNIGKDPLSISHLNLAFSGDVVDGTVTAKASELVTQFAPKGKRYTAKLAANESRSLGLVSTLPADSKRVGCDAIPLRLEDDKDVELSTGFVDHPPAAGKSCPTIAGGGRLRER